MASSMCVDGTRTSWWCAAPTTRPRNSRQRWRGWPGCVPDARSQWDSSPPARMARRWPCSLRRRPTPPRTWQMKWRREFRSARGSGPHTWSCFHRARCRAPAAESSDGARRAPSGWPTRFRRPKRSPPQGYWRRRHTETYATPARGWHGGRPTRRRLPRSDRTIAMYWATTTIDAPSRGVPSPAPLTANGVRLRPTLLGLSSAHPPFEVTMQESWDLLFQHMSPPVSFARRIIESTTVQKRHIMWDPDMLPQVCAMLTGDRMAAHAGAVLDVASRSVSQAIVGFDKGHIGSFVMACSTGYVNPGPDLLLAKELGLRSDLRRTFIGHMGCYAALNVIKVAMDSVAARPDELVICNCTELSSAHVRNSPMPEEDPMESLITQALFGDGTVSWSLGRGDPVPATPHRAALRPARDDEFEHRKPVVLDDAGRRRTGRAAGKHRRLSGQAPATAGTVRRRYHPLGNSPGRPEDPAGAGKTVGVAARPITGELGCPGQRRKLRLGNGAARARKHPAHR